jgi:hypothetical protein
MDSNEHERWSQRIEYALMELKSVPLSVALDCPPDPHESRGPQGSPASSSSPPHRRAR